MQDDVCLGPVQGELWQSDTAAVRLFLGVLLRVEHHVRAQKMRAELRRQTALYRLGQHVRAQLRVEAVQQVQREQALRRVVLGLPGQLSYRVGRERGVHVLRRQVPG